MRNFIILTFVLALIVAPVTMTAQTGGDLFKAKCAACHGANGEGKAALKTPDLKSDAVQKKSDADLKAFISTGAKHEFTKKGLTDDQINSLVKFIRSLK